MPTDELVEEETILAHRSVLGALGLLDTPSAAKVGSVGVNNSRIFHQ
ncbi:hypothetical protein HEP84_43395 [Streptomyces sp. RLB1-33]|nr:MULTISPECIES: hypothetical protein [Streptomyces]QIY74897.1 hypothetical protein HEP84_43395 [Streptomyces sp. RLB1-33]QUW77942.1 hypothetical protein SMIR_01210 [Streptomyces mirabilis]